MHRISIVSTGGGGDGAISINISLNSVMGFNIKYTV
jgi:hypothetical protein